MASRSQPANYQGMACPDSIRLGFTHGPNAPDAVVSLLGDFRSMPLGTRQTIQVDKAVFVGYLVAKEYDANLLTTTLRFIDWRDAFHDQLFFAAWNMQEDDGRYYHIFPDEWDNQPTSKDWSNQRKTYVTRAIKQEDFNNFQAYTADAVFHPAIGKNTLYAAYHLLLWLGYKLGFRMVAEGSTLNILKQSYPTNLDFNAGATIAEIITTILDKLNMQYTSLPSGVLYVSIRGFAESAFSNMLANGLFNPCLIGADSPSIGQELSERGRRVKLIGDHNKYEFIFLCQQNWNPAWTWDLAYGGAKLSALMETHGLTRFSKLWEMPEAYWDFETWTDSQDVGEGQINTRRTRSDMTIAEYLDKIVYKAYVIDFTTAAGDDFKSTVLKAFTGSTYFVDRETSNYVQRGSITEYNTNDKWEDRAGQAGALINSLYPLSRTLVTDSDLQFLLYATSRRIIRGAQQPFSDQYSMTPKNGGASLDVEEVLRLSTGRTEYRVRLFFNQPQFWINIDESVSEDDPKRILPDKIAVRLALDREIYQYSQGEKLGGVRVREQKVSVKNLYKAYVNGQEVEILKENFLESLKKQGAQVATTGIKADDLAKKLATQMLFHQIITQSGTMDFNDRAGFVPDGLIDSVSVTFNSVRGISETINFSNAWNAREVFRSFTPGNFSTKRRFENDIIRDRLKDLAKAAMKDKNIAVHAMTVMDAGLHEPGALYGTTIAATAFGGSGIVAVKYAKDTVLENPATPRQLRAFKKAN